MKKIISILIISLVATLQIVTAQQDSTWTLEKCIRYALQQNIQVRKSELSNERFGVYARTGQRLRDFLL